MEHRNTNNSYGSIMKYKFLEINIKEKVVNNQHTGKLIFKDIDEKKATVTVNFLISETEFKKIVDNKLLLNIDNKKKLDSYFYLFESV